MGFLAQAFAYLAFYIGKYLFGMGKESLTDYMARKEQEATNKKNIAKLKEAVKKGNPDEILEAERDLINGESN